MRTSRLENVDTDCPEYRGSYRVAGFDGIACRVIGWETEPVTAWYCPDCGRTYYEREHGGGWVGDKGNAYCAHTYSYYEEEPQHERTGRLAVVMIGDDRIHFVDESDVTPIDRSEYCGECGQIGCHCDGYAE